MAYVTAELKDKIMKLIAKNNYVFLSEVFANLPIGNSTFYEHFPNNSNDYKDITEELAKNRANIKSKMRHKWFSSDHPGLQIGLMKLLSDDEELRKLAMNFQSVEGGLKVEWNEVKNYESNEEAN